MLERIIYLLLAIIMSLPLSAQEKVTVNGYIKDGSNGETLIGATAYVKELAIGVTSNEYGFYSISIEPGTYQLEYAYLGFETEIQTIELIENTKVDVELSIGGIAIEEVVVTAEAQDKNVTDIEMSVNKLDIATIQKMPSLLGEVEIIRSIQLLPGITTVGEGATGFNVRGGSIDQNLVLLDEAPVYNSSHLFGFFSVFNPDAVKDVKLYKGGIPSRFGGRLSSILDVRMKEGNNKNLSFKGGIGTIFSRFSVEAPIVKDKSSFILAGRRSYIDILAKPFLSEDLGETVLNFYDLTLKTNYKFSEKDRIFLSGYLGRDNFGFGEQAGFNWGNGTATLRWNHLFSDRLFFNNTLYYSNYDYKIAFGDDSENAFDWNAGIINYSTKPEFTWFINPQNIIRFGGQGIYYEFEPGNAFGISEGETRDFSLPSKYAAEAAIYFENELDYKPFKINYGLRLSYFNYLGEGTSYEYGEAPQGQRRPAISSQIFEDWESIQKFARLEPRLSVKYQLNDETSLKASYMRTAQYIHLVSNTTASTPVDVWTPSTNNIEPQMADQVALGFFRNFDDNNYEFSTEVYYKNMKHLVDYIDDADLLLNPFLEGDLLDGDGRAYGWEMQLKKNKGKFSGWLSYTLARTERKIEGINDNEWYPSRFDQLHNFSLVGFYEVSKRLTLSTNFAFVTGTPTTFPTSRFEQQGYVIPHNAGTGRNNVRIPDYHRLDFGATWKGKDKPGKKWKGEWVFSVYNLYSRRNAFSIFFKPNTTDRIAPNEQVTTEAVRLSVIGNFIPAITYNFKFN